MSVVLVVVSNSLNGNVSCLLLLSLVSLESGLVSVELDLVSVHDGCHSSGSLMSSRPRSRGAVGTAEEERRSEGGQRGGAERDASNKLEV